MYRHGGGYEHGGSYGHSGGGGGGGGYGMYASAGTEHNHYQGGYENGVEPYY